MITRLTTLVVVFAMVVTACGSDASESASSPASTTTVRSSTTSTEGAASNSSVVATSVAAADTTAAPVSATAYLEQLRIYHPETLGFAAPFTMLDLQGPLSDVANEITIDTWATPDVLRSILVNGDAEVTAVPSYVGANLYNRGVDVRMAAVVVWGLVWVLGPEGTLADWESLRGETVMIPFPNDMPDLMFRYLATQNGMVPGEDFEIEYFAQPPEILARLVTGQGSFAVLPEHAATMVISITGQTGNPVGRVLDLQAEWASATGSSPRVPQAGIVVPGHIAENPGALAAVLTALEESVDLVNASSPETVEILSKTSGVPSEVVADAIPRLNLEVVSGAEAQEELEKFFAELASLSPDIIGGELPDDEFYLPDPR